MFDDFDTQIQSDELTFAKFAEEYENWVLGLFELSDVNEEKGGNDFEIE